MRGLPFQITGKDVVKVKKEKKLPLRSLASDCYSVFFLLQFFYPLVVSKILIECGPDGRPNGEADVYFGSHRDAVAAMSRDRQHIGKTVGEPLAAQYEENMY